MRSRTISRSDEREVERKTVTDRKLEVFQPGERKGRDRDRGREREREREYENRHNCRGHNPREMEKLENEFHVLRITRGRASMQVRKGQRLMFAVVRKHSSLIEEGEKKDIKLGDEGQKRDRSAVDGYS